MHEALGWILRIAKQQQKLGILLTLLAKEVI
jgi:hypothetical protein